MAPGVQRPTGDLFDIAEQEEAHFYSHAQGTIARFCERARPVRRRNAAAHRELAARHLVQSAEPEAWRLEAIACSPKTASATSASPAGPDGPPHRPDGEDRCPPRGVPAVRRPRFSIRCRSRPEDSSRYRYRALDEPLQDAQGMSMTAEGLLCRQWLGWPRGIRPDEEGDGVPALGKERAAVGRRAAGTSMPGTTPADAA